MTEEMKYLMHLCGCAAMGKQPQRPAEPLDWALIIRLANEQTVTYTAAMALKSGSAGCPTEIAEPLYSNLIGVSLKSKLRTAAIIALLGRMENTNLHPALLKGIDIARFYANPESRISADTDILVPKSEEKAAILFFESEGFTITPRNAQMHHTVCKHPEYGMFELHINLWEEMLDDVIFSGIGYKEISAESRSRVETPDGAYYSLQPEDSLLFITLHMLKHFLTCGMSLRMMTDTVLYYISNYNIVNHTHYWDFLRQLGFDKTVKVIFASMIEYCGFPINDFSFAVTDADIEMLLTDLEKGGWQGENDEARRDGWYYFKRERQRRQMGKIRYNLYIFADILRDRFCAVFPPADHLSKSYPILLKHRFLYLFCAIHRFFSKGFRAISSGKTKSRKNIAKIEQLENAGKERLELFVELEIF